MAGKYALLIGISTSGHGRLTRLSAPEEDVFALKQVLEDPHIAGFETTVRLNAGMNEARTGITDLFRNRAPDDLLLLYYTGHGIRDERGNLYLALPDTDPNSPSAISLEAEFIRKQMDNSTSRRQVLILDCCHSGAFSRSGQKREGASPTLVEDDFDPRGHGRFVLSASAANESAFEAEGRSIFTQHLVEALRSGEAAPEQEHITINDLYTYVARRVHSEQAPMRPMLWVDEQTEPLIIAQNPSPRKPLPNDAVENLWDPDMYRALGAAFRLSQFIRSEDASLARDAARVLEERLRRPDDLSVVVADAIRAGLDDYENIQSTGATRAGGAERGGTPRSDKKSRASVVAAHIPRLVKKALRLPLKDALAAKFGYIAGGAVVSAGIAIALLGVLAPAIKVPESVDVPSPSWLNKECSIERLRNSTYTLREDETCTLFDEGALTVETINQNGVQIRIDNEEPKWLDAIGDAVRLKNGEKALELVRINLNDQSVQFRVKIYQD